MRSIISFWFMVLFASSVFGFPYHVEQDVLDEVVFNQTRYENQPTDNEVMFDLAMSYAYSGQILKGWNLLKTIPKEYADTVIVTYEKLMSEDESEWRYPFKCAFGYFFVGNKAHAITLFHRVIDINPQQVWAYGFIALIYGEMGQVEKALEWCEKGLVVEPRATAIHFLMAEAYRKQKKYYLAFKKLLFVGRLQSL